MEREQGECGRDGIEAAISQNRVGNTLISKMRGEVLVSLVRLAVIFLPTI